MRRKWASVMIAAAMLLGSTAGFAQNDTEQSALPAGSVADMEQAQAMHVDTAMAVITGGVVVAGIVLLTTGTGNGTAATTTTGTGPL